jgi:ABC-type polysaccharide/polyol phosphate transport system ATPase subunit
MSSNDVAISVKNLSKRFEIYDRPADRLKQFLLTRIQRLLGRTPKQYFREFWALDDVSFEVKRGETVGIIGRNGSGKSTLLQMICGTLTPTAGNIQTNGRIAALLELGSGFNPEFTGRENVYMNAAVLGLTAHEIDESLNDIVLFADIGDFIDQPVKTYSSGMMVRLAFSVAVHVEPEILVVDEALAVGDLVFQMKCLDKMEQIKSSGTTILFVSHGLEQVKRFCESAIWIDHGKARLLGNSNYVSDQYRDSSIGSERRPLEEDGVNVNNSPAIIRSVELSAAKLAPFDPFSVQVTYELQGKALPKILIGVAIRDAKGVYLFGPNTYLDKFNIPATNGTHTIEYFIPKLPLLTGTFMIDVGLFTDGGVVCLDYLGAVREFDVVADYFSEGLVFIDHEWSLVNHG